MKESKLINLGIRISKMDNYPKLLILAELAEEIEVNELTTNRYATAYQEDGVVHLSFEDNIKNKNRSIMPEEFNRDFEIRNLALW